VTQRQCILLAMPRSECRSEPFLPFDWGLPIETEMGTNAGQNPHRSRSPVIDPFYTYYAVFRKPCKTCK